VVLIEHKEIDDFWTSVTTNAHDFKEKMQYMAKLERKYVIINALESETLAWRSHRDVHPNSIRHAIATIEGPVGVPIHFSESIEDSERWLLDWFIKFYREKRKL
jgi:ERCC4-type nuclease